MCPDCSWTCKAFQGFDGFCDNNSAVDMLMEGFVTYGFTGNPDASCLMLFFGSWVLDTPLKFWAATLGVLLLGMAVEGISVVSFSPGTGLVTRVLRPGLLHTFRMTLAYLLMLATMTFSLEMFGAVVFGLGFGHMVFKRNGRQDQAGMSGPSPCCSHGSPTRVGVSVPPRTSGHLAHAHQDAELGGANGSGLAELVTLRIDGMTCSSCTRTVEGALLAVPGVIQVSVSLDRGEGRAVVRLRDRLEKTSALLAAVDDVGFTAVLQTPK